MSDNTVTFAVSKALAKRVERLAARGDLTARDGIGAMLEAYVDMMEWGHNVAADIEKRAAEGDPIVKNAGRPYAEFRAAIRKGEA